MIESLLHTHTDLFDAKTTFCNQYFFIVWLLFYQGAFMNSLLPKNWLTLPPNHLAALAPTQELDWPAINNRGIKLSIRRDDLIDPIMGGNKIYKLHGHLNNYLKQHADDLTNTKRQPIASFGGAYSNHLYALAGACQQQNIPFIAIIRGEEPQQLSPTLTDIVHMGTKLHFISRSEYRQKNQTDYLLQLEQTLGSCYWIPEGGGGLHALTGCYALGESLAQSTANAVIHACGTGASLAGIINGVAGYEQKNSTRQAHTTEVIGISALKSDASIVKNILSLAHPTALSQVNWRVSNQFHLGGYAKKTNQLENFIQDTKNQLNIALDPVYTAKTLWAIEQLCEQNYWRENSHIMFVHSGGVQGARQNAY